MTHPNTNEAVLTAHAFHPVFPFGDLFMTAAIQTRLNTPDGPAILDALRRHAACDWGELDADDTRANDVALYEEDRLLSVYTLPSGTKIYIVTEADRSRTTLLEREEY